MKDENRLKNAKELNQASQSLDQYMFGQVEVNEYKQLIKIINAQLYSLLNPLATYYSEYDAENKGLQMKEIKAEPSVVESVLKIGGKEFFSTIAPVNEEMYGKLTTDHMVVFSTLTDLTGGANPESVSESIGKTLNVKSYLRLAYMIDGQLYGTSVIALKETPDHSVMKLLKTYAYFTSMTLKRILTAEALRKSEQELRTIADNMTDVVAMADVEGRFTYLSESNYQLTGYKPSELLGKNIFDLMHEDDLSAIGAIFQEGVVEGRKDARVEYRVRKKDDDYVWVETIGSLVFDDNGKPSGALFTSRDITDRKQAEEDLRRSEEHLQAIAGSLDGILYAVDSDLRYTFSKGRKLSTLGLRQDEYIGKTMYEWFETEDPKHPTIKAHLKALNGEVVQQEAVRGDYVYSTVLSPLRDENGVIIGVAGLLTDITEQKKAYEKIRHMSYHDQLTDLYNRHYFEYVKNELKELPVISVIMTDVNGLKLINDTYGHEAGDELLKKYAELLMKSFKQSDLIFRWGGDEFIAILKNTDEAKSWELCNRLMKHCGETFVKDIPLSISVGISSKLQGGNIDKAIQEAENMMYKNKLIESKSSKNLIMKTLQQALAEKSFETKEHIDRITLVGRQFGEKLGLSVSELSRLETLALLHDIGKINIDSHILLKETTLTDEEWEEIKKHPEVGYRITRTTEEFAYIAEDILAHHERWDGNGYPQGLQGENTPYLARLLNLIDSYDVMSNGRPYKKKMSSEEIIEEIERCSGKQFDPDLAKVFIACLKEGAIAYQ